MHKKIFAAAAVVGIVCSAVAQNIEGVNARIDAMGGFGIPADMGWTIDKPCALYLFPDRIQTSAIIKDIEGMGKSFGSIIAVKSLCRNLFVGMTLNDRKPMSGKFYSLSREFFPGFQDDFGYLENPGRYLPNLPHVNICYKPSDKLSLGLGLFAETSHHSEEYNKEFKYTYMEGAVPTQAVVRYDSTTERNYFGPGIVADARIWLGSIRLNPEFKIFIPKLEGIDNANLGSMFPESRKQSVTQNMLIADISDNAVTTGLGKNLFLRTGGKVSGTYKGTFLIGGVWFKTERFQLKRTLQLDTAALVPSTPPVTGTAITDRTTFAFNNSSFDWWIGCQPSFSDKTIFGCEYGGNVQFSKSTPPANTFNDSTLITIKHKIRMGVEGSMPAFMNLTFHPRMGLTFSATREIWHYKGVNSFDSTNSSQDVQWPYSTNWDKDNQNEGGKGTKVSAGLGLEGKRGCFDISFDVLTWNTSALVGPSAAMVSFTFNFGSMKTE